MGSSVDFKQDIDVPYIATTSRQTGGINMAKVVRGNSIFYALCTITRIQTVVSWKGVIQALTLILVEYG